jgi:hypothetical protein
VYNYTNRNVEFLKSKLPQFGNHEKQKILSGFKSFPVMKLNVESRGYDS